MARPNIILNNVHYSFETHALRDLSCCFEQARYGIVGDNGVGKSTLLKLIAAELEAEQGSIQRQGSIYLMPQLHSNIDDQQSIAAVLGVALYVDALKRINSGDGTPDDFDLLADHWDLEIRIQEGFRQLKLTALDLTQPFQHLSGGQKTKLLLMKTLIFQYDFVLLDEPTNNLDSQAREILYDFVKQYRKGMIIVSHDRTLLNHLDNILEITTLGINCYGGNYDFYREQKAMHELALQQALHAKIDKLSTAQQTVQTRMERHQQNEAKGRKIKYEQIKATGSYDKLALKSQKGCSENTNKRIRQQGARKLSLIQDELNLLKEQVEIKRSIHAELQQIKLPSQKILLEAEHISYRYTDNADWIIRDFNLTLTGTDRMALCGPNGSGKSTLIKLLLGQLQPQAGILKTHTKRIVYIDQNISHLDLALSLVDNYRLLHPGTSYQDAYSRLATFNFRSTQAEKLAQHLSGGERMRASLATHLLASLPPELIILDEPTNHLDVRSLEAVESILNHYQGTLLIVSHDRTFLERLHIEKCIEIN